MHGGLLIFLWLAAVALMQRLPPHWLGWLLLSLTIACLLLARDRAFRLLRRIRVLLLAIVVLFAWFTPGTRILVDLPALSPSLEGVRLAFEHAGRVLAVVLSVALLMQSVSASRLVGALYALLRPFEHLGLPADRIAVRTLLVLEFVEGRPKVGWRQWLTPVEEGSASAPVSVPVEPFRWHDWLILVFGLAILVAAWVAT